MEFLKEFGAKHLVVFSPNRNAGTAEGAFEAMCQSFNELGRAAGEMGFRAGLHNHIGQMVQTPDELDRCMRLTDPKLFWFSPDTAHLHLAGLDVVKTLAKLQRPPDAGRLQRRQKAGRPGDASTGTPSSTWATAKSISPPVTAS